MAKADPALDPLGQDLDEAHRLYQLLAAKVPPGQGDPGGRRPTPGSRPPVQIDPLSLMAELEQYLTWWLGQARWLLNPIRRIDITRRTGAICPYCQGGLVCWLQDERAEPSEVVCDTPTKHDPGQPYRWTKADWSWLGRLTGVYDDTPSGTARPPWEQATG